MDLVVLVVVAQEAQEALVAQGDPEDRVIHQMMTPLRLMTTITTTPSSYP
jgi:hypothetical protein